MSSSLRTNPASAMKSVVWMSTLVLSTSVAGLSSARQTPASSPARTTFTVPPGDSIQLGAASALALSRAGDRLVYVGRHGDVTRLYLQTLARGSITRKSPPCRWRRAKYGQ